jgi:hypothetical protein
VRTGKETAGPSTAVSFSVLTQSVRSQTTALK